MHLALVHQTALVVVQVLDGILDRQNVAAALGVDLVDHGGERGGLAAAGRAGHEHQPARALGQLFEHGRQPQLVEAADAIRDDAVDAGHRASLVEHVAPEASQSANSEGDVQLLRFLEPLLLRVGQHAVGQLFGVGEARAPAARDAASRRARAPAAACRSSREGPSPSSRPSSSTAQSTSSCARSLGVSRRHPNPCATSPSRGPPLRAWSRLPSPSAARSV